jgi:aromatic ring-cleaving dioxygenase
MGTVYIISSPNSNDFYIGETTKSLETRWKQHLENVKYNKQQCPKLCQWLQEYQNSATCEVIEEVAGDELHDREKELIWFLKPSLNIVRKEPFYKSDFWYWATRELR